MTKKDNGLYIELESLGNYARNIALTLKPEGEVPSSGLISELRKAIERLGERAERFSKSPGNISGGVWLQDNMYIAEREGKKTIFELKNCGKLMGTTGKRVRISQVAYSIISSGKGQVTEERIGVFLNEYQKVEILTEKELDYLVPIMRLELIMLLDRVSEGDIENDEVIGNIFTSLSFLATADMTEKLLKVNRIEQELCRDPAGVYPLMDDDTKSYYRKAVSRLGRKHKMTEIDTAKKAVSLAENSDENHVGYYIFKKPLGEKERENSGGLYIITIVLLSLFLTVLAGIAMNSLWSSVVLLVPIWEIVKNLVDFAILRIVKPKRLPRLNLENGIPKQGRTLCVISAILGSEGDGEKYSSLLEEYMLLNRDAGENLLFGILADLPEAKTETTDNDEKNIKSAVSSIEKLNRKYGDRFYLFIRKRQYSNSDGIYMPKERKRGAILELVRKLTEKETKIITLAGKDSKLLPISYLITLDADTRLTAGSVTELVGTAMHPLNVPVYSHEKGRVTSGYGILQPRVSVDLTSAGKSDFTKIFAGLGGVDPYGSVTSDVYQDLFSFGSFSGKGLINVPCYGSCLDSTIPDNSVLSHDLIEGAYLRCGYISDVEVTDGFPYKITSYFSRMDRWTRGDWQNLPWLFGKVKNGNGDTTNNPLSDIDKWKIFDNLRRSLVPPMTFIALFAGMFLKGRQFIFAAVIAILSQVTGLLLSWASLMFKHDSGSRARYQSTIISGVAGAIMETFIKLMLLPAEAFTQIRAIITALYRMTFSHKNMLLWVTSSETEKKHGNTIGVNYLKLGACPISGLIILLFSKNAAAIAVGIIWMVTPIYAWALSRENKIKWGISEYNREYLTSCAQKIWGYFDEMLSESDNFLPPDNFQEEPSLGKAHRTSPTNIGLTLMSVISAFDLGFIALDRADNILGKILETVTKLPKWKGHLYNWYDTKTLDVLTPKYISAVDSGNLASCLIILKETSELSENVRKTADSLLEAMDFRPLFDKKRKLFYIGWDEDKNAPTQGWYDLMESEERITSYVAVSMGQVPVKHWRHLGRTLVSMDNYSGMVSWTGTMFEYLMPNLILPCYKNSLIYESSKFCIYVQKKANMGIPWGISESGFYSFDPGMAYSYKAHGVGRLALKRRMDTEKVVAPYATFLALPLDTGAALKNLKYLERLGATGKYGFYEAVDFTPSRTRNGKFEIVRSYMVHHLGMSMMAIDNVLLDNIMPRRFMSDVRMNAYKELLQEKVPVGEVVLKKPTRDVPEKPERHCDGSFELHDNNIDSITPRCVPLSNGVYNVLLAENGKSRSMWHGRLMTDWDNDVTGKNGIEFYLKIDDRIYSLLPSPMYDRNVSYSFTFNGEEGTIEAKTSDFSSKVTVSIPSSTSGEIRSVELNMAKDYDSISLICVFTPALDRKKNFDAHKTFSKLSLESKTRDKSVVISRRPGGTGDAMSFALSCDSDCVFGTSESRGVFPESPDNKKASPEMRVSCTVPIKPAKGRAKVNFTLCPGETEEEALSSSQALLSSREKSTVSRIHASYVMLKLKERDIYEAAELTSRLIFGYPKSNEAVKLLESGHYSVKDLWRFGISGDRPIIAMKVTDENTDRMESLIRKHRFLTENGVESDLALLLNDGGDYRKPQKQAVLDLLGKLGTNLDDSGVYLVDAGADRADGIAALSDVYVDGDMELNHHLRLPPEWHPYIRKRDGMLAQRFDEENEFKVALQGCLALLAWSNILTNGNFGFAATDAGAGRMWYKNSHEMRINRWLNDPITADGTEKLYLIRGDEKISLFARGDEHPTMLTYGFGYMCWEKEIYGTKFKLTAFVPEDADVRVFIAECDELRAGDRLCYYTDIVMGGENKTSPTAVTELSDGVISVTDKASPFGDMAFKVCSSNKPIAFTTDKNAYLEGNLDGRLGAGFNLCVATEYSLEKKLVIVTGCDSVDKIKALSQIMTAEKSLSDTKNMWRQRVKPIIVNTPDSDLNSFINGWALYQVYSCRILGRTSIYQNGGAYGFRDQLQDVLSLIPFMPDVAREQIKRASSHQYMEGDVQHWWHSMPDGEHGVRTRISDDLLWLPYVLCRYVTETGDYSICREETGYLMSKELSEDEHDRYEVPEYSGNKDSIYNHAKKAIEKFINRGVGEHGLALIGTGDWNDGMNGVGEKGKGESVWLSLFGAIVLEKMSYLCLKNGEKQISERYSEYSEKLKRASEKAWDGKWFLRGYYDDGRPIGSQDSEECKIDSIAQSFAVFSKIDPEKRKTALKSAYSQLYDRENRIVKLFTPPFDKGAGNPGYIKSYSPGFRENGGQYTHGAVWLSMALLEEGMVKEGYDILHALLPGGRNEEVYKAEPFVIAADVYANENNLGRGGWSWYTGAAGWMYNTATQYLLGLKIRDGRLYIEPNIPDDWGECSVLYRVGNDYIHIEIGKMPERQIKVDGKDYDNSGYSLKIYNNFIFKW